MSFDVSEIISAMEFATLQGLSHVLTDDGRTRVAIWREGSRMPANAAAAAVTAPVPLPEPAGQVVTAPLSGQCHLAPDPVSTPFVQEGDEITAGQTLCIIEAMKVMTAVPAPIGGRVVRVQVANGTAVAAGEPLMEIMP